MSTSYNNKLRERIETPEKQVAFINEIEAVCKKYGLSISHEDGHGSFVICHFDQSDIEWLRAAIVDWL